MHNVNRDEWRWLSQDGDLSPWMKCGDCAQWIPLIDYEVSEAGIIDKRVHCPHQGCEFSTDVKLEGWKA